MSLPKASELLQVFAGSEDLRKMASRFGMSPEEFRKHLLSTAQRLKAEESKEDQQKAAPRSSSFALESEAPKASKSAKAVKTSKASASSPSPASTTSGTTKTSRTAKTKASGTQDPPAATSTARKSSRAAKARAKGDDSQIDLGLDGSPAQGRKDAEPKPASKPAAESRALQSASSGPSAEKATPEKAGGKEHKPAPKPPAPKSAGEARTVPFRKVIVYSDGAARGNPGPAGAGAVVMSPSGHVLARKGRFLGRQTNNVAEYEGALLGLRAALELGAKEVELRADSMLLVMQLNGRWKVKNAGLMPLVLAAKRLLAQFDSYKLEHVPRELNLQADEMSNRAIDERMSD